ncbi:tautomerase family protein [Burkholderia gladioli pv. gladioli]|nr:tautomerase family protein [Burkholderia gladioli pv. gladioli]AWY51505.1 tautomerase family protein [Burkholderia gladioli pv. gladioli]
MRISTYCKARAGRYDSTQKMAIAEALNQSLVEVLDIPRGDRFVMLIERGEDELFIDPDFMGMQRSDKAMIITVLLGAHRGQDDKTALLAAERVEAHPDDVFAALVPVPNENFSFGRGIAQLMGGAPRW